MNRTIVKAALPLALLGGTLTACSDGNTPKANGTPTPGASDSPSEVPSAGQPNAPAATPTTTAPNGGPTSRPVAQPGLSRCHTSMLSASLAATDAAAGHRYAYLTLTNRSGTRCRLYGYVGMQLLTASGAPLTTNVERLGQPAPATVTLAPGTSVRTRVGWTVVPTGSEPVDGPCAPTPARVQVTPPDELDHLTIPWTQGMVCGLGRLAVTPVGGV
ncbi:DUF4232 domain-containing protein [Actinomadura rayongensis]|uniref:DUF4232 domain-containing protein n=1 Tax=Actinomadura rayongensis TaxID=1429076 RepID=A0A6I4WJ99_9ACTN|nr:DUF4232 domain-containing protein [Actinomadura rayongensis]MXQ67074.1 DUF4232 domain-containing protein [Actinomadura rayongensis]